MRLQLKPSSLVLDRCPARNAAGPAAGRRVRREAGGFTFMEVLIALIIVGVVFGAIINGYLSTSVRGQWTGYSLAAQSFGLQAIEQARSAKWDSGVNQLTNLALLGPPSYNSGTKTFTGYTTNILDVPWKGTNFIVATNYISIRLFNENNDPSANSPQLQMIRVDTVWPFTDWSGFAAKYYTNTVCTLIAPDNRDPSTLGATPPPQD